MPILSSIQVPPPKNWQDFETLCCDLWRAIWKDPNAKKHGRQGQGQHGVDIFGNPLQQTEWAGVQCKGKDTYTDKILTEDELRREAEKAKTFAPALARFTIATTGPRDATIQQVARTLSDEYRKAGSFGIDVWSWDDIVESLSQHPDVVAAHYPEFALTANVREGMTRVLATQRESLNQQAQTTEDIKAHVSVAVSQVEQKVAALPESLLATLSSYHDSALKLASEYLKGNKPNQALEYLEYQRRALWPQASSQTKARLLTAIGAAKLALTEERRAAELFLEALQYTPDDEKTLCNAAVACLLLDDLPEALKRAMQILEKNPANYMARSVAIQASKEPLETIIDDLPAFCKENRDVAVALGTVSRRQGDLERAVHWFRVAASKGDDVPPEITAILGQTLFDFVKQNKTSSFQIAEITDTIRAMLEEIERLLTGAWNAVPEEAYKRARVPWLINRGMVRRILHKKADARADFEDALRLHSNHPVARFFCAAIAYDDGEAAKALAIAQTIEDTDEIPNLPIFVADLLNRTKRPDDAIRVLEQFVQNNPDAEAKATAQEMLIQVFHQKGDLGSANGLCDNLLKVTPTNVRFLVMASITRREEGSTGLADNLIETAIQCVTDATPLHHILSLSDELYTLKRFDDAIATYERIVQPSLNTALTHRMLNACYLASKLDKALAICREIQRVHGPQQYVAEMESAIFEEIGDLTASQKACEDYLKAVPDDAQMRVRLSVVHLRQRNDEALDEFLANPPDWTTLPVVMAVQIANLYAVRERYQEASELLYKIRRKHPEGSVHLRYIQSCMFHGDEDNEWLKINEVIPNTAVCVEDAASNHHWFILECADDARIESGEITSSHRLWNELLGKRVGDFLLLKESTISPEQGKIVAIKSKYLHALHECGEMLQTRYPEIKGFEAVHFPEEPEAGLKKILEDVSKRQDAQTQMIQLYENNQLPIGGLGTFLGRDVYDAWSALVDERGTKLRCCFGAPEERRYAVEEFRKAPRRKLIVDPVSLMTMDVLGVRDEIVQIAGRLGIAQSTIDLISETLHKRKAVDRRGFMTLSKQDGKFIRRDVTPEDVGRNLAWLTNLLEWINVNCDVLSSPLSIKMNRDNRKRLSDLLGDESVDTILVAAGEGRLIYSDDLWLRGLAKGELGVDGVWTQVLLMEGVEGGKLDRERYNQAVISLVCAGYVHTSVGSQLLLAAARRADWKAEWPFGEVADVLGGGNCDDQLAIQVAADFIVLLLSEKVGPPSFAYLVWRLLDGLGQRRATQFVVNSFAREMRRRFARNVIAEGDILRLMKTWASLRPI